MKATGVIRRIDDLGRVVIPKEIRRTMNTREGEPLEIFLEDGGVVFKKYLPNCRDDLVSALRNAAEYYDDHEDNRTIARQLEKSQKKLTRFFLKIQAALEKSWSARHLR